MIPGLSKQEILQYLVAKSTHSIKNLSLTGITNLICLFLPRKVLLDFFK